MTITNSLISIDEQNDDLAQTIFSRGIQGLNNLYLSIEHTHLMNTISSEEETYSVCVIIISYKNISNRLNVVKEIADHSDMLLVYVTDIETDDKHFKSNELSSIVDTIFEMTGDEQDMTIYWSIKSLIESYEISGLVGTDVVDIKYILQGNIIGEVFTAESEIGHNIKSVLEELLSKQLYSKRMLERVQGVHISIRGRNANFGQIKDIVTFSEECINSSAVITPDLIQDDTISNTLRVVVTLLST